MRQILPVAGPTEIRRHARRLARRHPRTLSVALVLHGLFASEANYEIVSAEDLPLGYDSLNDMPEGLEVRPYLRSVG